MLLNVPKFVKTAIPVDKRAAMQNWFNTWMPEKSVSASVLFATLPSIVSSSPVLCYTSVVVSLLGTCGIFKAMELKNQKTNNDPHPWMLLADIVEAQMPPWYPNAQANRRDSIIMLSELLRVTWSLDLPTDSKTPQRSLSLNHQIVSGKQTEMPSIYTTEVYNKDFEFNQIHLIRLLTTCYLHIAYEEATQSIYPSSSLKETILNELNKYAESIWIGRTFSSFVIKYTSAWEHTKWPAAVQMAVDMEILKPRLTGYVQFKLLDKIVDMHTKTIALPVLDNMDLSSGSQF